MKTAIAPSRNSSPAGPAEACRQLEPEDIILKVGQGESGEFVDVVDMKLTKIVELIKGPKDTVVRLFIKPGKSPSERKTVNITRDRIKLTANLASATVHEAPAPEGDKTPTVGIVVAFLLRIRTWRSQGQGLRRR